MRLINAAFSSPNSELPEIALPVERLVLAKRIWRGKAEDGAEFGFELSAPLKNEDVFWQTPQARYVIRQNPEPVVEISLEIAPSAAAGIGWAIGNLHLELAADATRLLAPDEPAVRQLLDRLKVPFKATTAIFRPGRFARGNPAQPVHDLGPSHKH
jgi:urease accessory protein